MESDPADAFDAVVAAADSAMAVVTTAVDGERAGCLVGFHAQSSIAPARYAVWLSKANHTYRVGLRATHLAVHLLAAGDHDLAEHFGALTGDAVDKFAGVAWRPGPAGVPLLDRCPARLVLARTSLVDEGGDHVLVVGEPVVASAPPADFAPLRLGAAADIRPGHAAGDHP
ncbi:MAG TPA: flavin reductase family protein [Acidimicrobiales bacterium]|nr:flavin reductase family protein [Acidimicrobiales bacterium]